VEALLNCPVCPPPLNPAMGAHHTYLVAIDSIFVKSPFFPRKWDGIGTRMRVPVGVPLSSTRTILLVS